LRAAVSREAGATKTFRYDGGGYLDFAPYELRSITSVTSGGVALVAGDGAGAGDYLARPRNKTLEGTWLWLDVRSYLKPYPTNSLYSIVLNERDVVIVGDWGMSAVPADVELACLIAVADLYRNPEQGSNRGAEGFSISEIADNPGSEESLPVWRAPAARAVRPAEGRLAWRAEIRCA
jgi:hypothetical protein